MKEEKILIRRGDASDANGIARVHVDSWRTTYRGILPDAVLDSLSYGQRAQRWRENLAGWEADQFLLVGALEAGPIIGFCAGGPHRRGTPHYDGEIGALYLLQQYQGEGIGRRLFYRGAQELRQRGFRNLIVTVLAANPACNFYEALGGRKVEEGVSTIAGEPYPDVAYGGDDIEPLAGLAGND